LNQRVAKLSAKNGHEYDDFIYAIVSQPGFDQFVMNNAHGSAQPNVSADGIGRILIPLFQPDEQLAIGRCIGALDDKIELNRQMNRTLERVTRAIFKAWFVDFEPVKAKAAGAHSFPSIHQDAFDCLPTRLIESDLGLIPEGWVLSAMGDIGHQRREQVAPDDTAEGTAYIGLEHMPRRCIALSNWGTADTVTSAKSRFKTGEILFGKLRPYFHKVGPAPVDGVCSTDIVVLSAKRTNEAAWLLMLVSSDEFVSHANQTSAGTKMPRTNWRDMASFPMALPPVDLLGAFQQIAAPMLDLIRQNIWESRKLTALRNYLLPKLLRGEVRVVDGERSTS
jgi:type I restriction enzyme S subunit